MTENPLLSVVIIGRNEGPRLVRCLKSVQAMRACGGLVEIIYVDSASDDGSPQRAQELGAKVLTVQPVRPTAALGRNAGWRAASAPFVLFLDGDTILDPSFVADSLPELQASPHTAIIWGHRRELAPHASIYQRVLDLDWIYAPGPTDFCGGDALMRRAVLEEVGGFDETLIAGEEPEMCRRIRARGYDISHVDRAMTGHDLAITRAGQYWQRATRAGYAYATVAARFRHTDTPFWAGEVRRNWLRGSLWAALSLGAIASAALTLGIIISAVATHSLHLLSALVLACAAPLLLALGGLLLASLRTAYKARWKTSDRATLLLYGVHSQLQQIPILGGQINALRDQRAGRMRGLIEYKTAAGGQNL